MFPRNFKCVFVGDDDIGKTSIVHRYLFDDFGPEYLPTAKQDYVVNRWITNSCTGELDSVALHICDTGGLSVLDRLRPLCYGDMDVLVVCFSVVMPSSYKSIMTRWLPEIKRHTARNNVSLILVGTQIDLRSNFKVLLKLSEEGLAPVSECKGFRLAKKIGAACYIECSAASRRNVEYVFDTTLLWSLKRYDGSVTSSSSSPIPGLSLSGFPFKFNANNSASPVSKKEKTCPKSKSSTKGSTPMSQSIGGPGLTGGGIKSAPKAIKKSSTRGRKVSKLKRILLMSCFA